MTQQSENAKYLPMSLERHSLSDVAGLIYESAPELFALMFGADAVMYLTQLVARSQNRFSYQYVRIAEIDDRVVGVATFIPADCVTNNGDYFEILNPIQKLWLKLIQWFILRYVLQQTYPSESFYIGNLAVAAEYRNQGIGRQLLSHCIAEVASTTIFISVDASNTRAQKLYESLGFQEVAIKTINLFGNTIGSHILSLIPNLSH